jgi:hypothetical protein
LVWSNFADIGGVVSGFVTGGSKQLCEDQARKITFKVFLDNFNYFTFNGVKRLGIPSFRAW